MRSLKPIPLVVNDNEMLQFGIIAVICRLNNLNNSDAIVLFCDGFLKCVKGWVKFAVSRQDPDGTSGIVGKQFM